MIQLLVPKVPELGAIAPYLAKIDNARWYTNGGQLVRQLEERLCRHYGAYVVTVSSCTAGLELVYRLRRMQGMTEIELPALTFPATYLAAHTAGLEVKLADVDIKTWTHSAVAGFGLPVNGDTVDAAAAWGEQRVRPGQTCVFSLHATKILGAGEGGYIVTGNPEEARAIRDMSNFGMNGNGRPSRGWGTNAKMSEYHAAVALASLDAWRREPWQELASWYHKWLPSCVRRQERDVDGVYPVLAVQLPVPAEPVARFMQACGCETRRWYSPPGYRHPLFKTDPTKFPVTMLLEERLLGLPWHLWLTEEDVKRVTDVLIDAIRKEERRAA